MRVECDDVTKRFGRVRALHGVSASIASGQAVALLGPNGSGKSTLTRAIMGLISHTGHVRLDGEPRERVPTRFMRRIAYVPQIAPQLAAPVGELVRAICDVRGVPSPDVATVASELELDLAAIAKQSFRTLSGGTKQKVLIALALASRAELLLMDEPTASLDAQARGRFFEVFSERRGDATLLLTSHRIEEIRHLVGHVLALREGEVAYDGPAARYLADREQSVIEVLVEGHDADVAWFAASGFRSGAPGWWVKVVDRPDKLATLPPLLAHFGARLLNVVVRDFERLGAEAPDAKRPEVSG